MTLGGAASAGVRFTVWCRDCRDWVEPDPAEQAGRYGAEIAVPDWRERLVCSGCGEPRADQLGLIQGQCAPEVVESGTKVSTTTEQRQRTRGDHATEVERLARELYDAVLTPTLAGEF